MGLIRVSDYAEKQIKRMAAETGRTVTSTVDTLLEGNSGGVDLIAAVDKRFDELKALIEDTTVDRLDKARSSKLLPSDITWENCIQDVYFDFPDDDPVWLPKVKEAWGESDSMDMAEFSSDGSYIYDVTGGERMPVLNITPALRDYLKGKGFVL